VRLVWQHHRAVKPGWKMILADWPRVLLVADSGRSCWVGYLYPFSLDPHPGLADFHPGRFVRAGRHLAGVSRGQEESGYLGFWVALLISLMRLPWSPGDE